MSNLLKSVQPSDKRIKLTHSPPTGSAPSLIEQRAVLRMEEELEDLVTKKNELTRQVDELKQKEKELIQQVGQKRKELEQEIADWWRVQEEELERLREEAYQQGYQEGYKVGQRDGEARYTEKVKQAEAVIKEAYRQRDQLMEQAEPDLLCLASVMAQKVIGQELRQAPEALKSLINQGLKQIIERERVYLHVAVETYPLCVSYMDEWREAIEAELVLIPDQALKEDQFVLHTEQGAYDFSVEKQINELKGQLLNWCKERNTGD